MKKILLIAIVFVCISINIFGQNVGIGTLSPTARLQVNHASAAGPGVLLKDSSNSAAGLLQFQNVSSNKFITVKGWAYGNSANSFLDVSSDSAFVATFRGNGNMGVGNLNPNERLDVAGNINVTGTIKANGIPGQPGQVLTAASGGTLAWSDMVPYGNFMTFTTVGTSTWTVPAGVTKIMVEGWGGGAGNYGSYAGGGGGYVKAILNVTPGGSVQVIVGAGGMGIMSGGLCGVSGASSSISFGSASATAYGGSAHCQYIVGSSLYTETGGPFSASAGVPFLGQNGEMGVLFNDHYETNPAGSTYLTHFGNGGDGGNAPNTGALGGYAYYNYSTSALIGGGNPLRLAAIPGGGGAGGTAANNGAQGMVIIHY